MRDKPYVLFVTEKWMDAVPTKPITNSKHNLFGSLEQSGLATFKCLHYDEFFYQNGKNIDDFLIEIVNEEKPDAVIYMPLPWYPHCPTAASFSAISDKTKLILICADAVAFMDTLESLERYMSLVVLWDTDRDWRPGTKFIHLWTPQDPTIYNNPELDRDINLSFVGTNTYPDRARTISYLQRNNIHLEVVGGRDHQVPVESYAEILKRSKMTLNFSVSSGGVAQLKGRPFEATLCGAMLFEGHNYMNWIERWFMPDVHFVYFYSEMDLKDKINYYLTHDDERIRIAQNGCRRATEYYNNVSWWRIVFREANVNMNMNTVLL
jgi:hypothetical protein